MKSFGRAPQSAWTSKAIPLVLTFVSGVGAVILGYAASASASGGTPCAACDLKMRQAAFSPLSSASDPTGSPLPANIASILNHMPEYVKFPNAPTLASKTPLWNGQGDLPNSFQPTFQFAKTNFDPSFRTSYWSEDTGPRNVASAPWRQGVTSRYGDEVYGAGMLYVGTPYQAPLSLDFAPLDMTI